MWEGMAYGGLPFWARVVLCQMLSLINVYEWLILETP